MGVMTNNLLDVESLTERYGPMVLRRCRHLLKDEEEALDICQDVFVRVIEQSGRLDARHPSSLLYVMATNLCLNRIRDCGRHAAPTDDAQLQLIAAAGEPAVRSEARLVLDWLFKRHPASSRTIAVLHYLDGLTLEQVASEVGLSVSGVRKRLRNLRHTLEEMKP
jgi:RNA polymerase sigma-70 factor (ECF subfamily)